MRLQQRAWELGLAALVEVHDEEELARAIDSGARIIGVNNRNLRTLAVDVEASDGWRRGCRRTSIGVSESGLQSRADLERLAAAGYRAFLIGERFMTDPDPAKAIAELLGVGSHLIEDSAARTRECPQQMTSDPILKICGITRLARRAARRASRARRRSGSCSGRRARER